MSDTRMRRLFRAAGVAAGVLALAGCAETDLKESLGGSTRGPDCGDGQGEFREVEDIEYEVTRAREEWAKTLGRRGQLPGGFEDDVLAAARTVGTRVRESVVYLELPSGHATGWYIDDHHIATNSHNVLGLPSVTAWTVDGSSFDVDVVEAVPGMLPDVALLRAERTGTPLPLGSAASLEPGDEVVQVGNPGAVGNWLIAVGRQVRTSRISQGDDAPQSGPGVVPEITTSVPGAQGNSGSPLVNLDGEVVGMTHGGTDQDPLPLDGPPEPSEPTVYDWPIAAKTWSRHVPIETVVELYEEWR